MPWNRRANEPGTHARSFIRGCAAAGGPDANVRFLVCEWPLLRRLCGGFGGIPGIQHGFVSAVAGKLAEHNFQTCARTLVMSMQQRTRPDVSSSIGVYRAQATFSAVDLTIKIKLSNTKTYILRHLIVHETIE